MAVVRREGTKSQTNSKPAKKKKATKRTSSVSLPTKRNQPPDKITGFTHMILGEKGIGKSSLAAQFPDAITFMFEPGRMNLNIFQVPEQGEPNLNGPEGWERFKEYVDLVIDKGRKTVIIDTVDRAYEACFDFCCHERGCSEPSELGKQSFGVWNAIKKEFEGTMSSMIHEGITVIFISHARVKTVESRTGGEDFDQMTATCSPACASYIKAVADYVFYYGYFGKQRALTVRGDELVWSACGVDNTFMDKDSGEPIATFSAGGSPKEAYDNLLKGFKNKLEGLTIAGEEEEEEEEGDDEKDRRIQRKAQRKG